MFLVTNVYSRSCLIIVERKENIIENCLTLEYPKKNLNTINFHAIFIWVFYSRTPISSLTLFLGTFLALFLIKRIFVVLFLCIGDPLAQKLPDTSIKLTRICKFSSHFEPYFKGARATNNNTICKPQVYNSPSCILPIQSLRRLN